MKLLKNAVVLTFIFGMSFSSVNAGYFQTLQSKDLREDAFLLCRRTFDGGASIACGYLACQSPDPACKYALASIAITIGSAVMSSFPLKYLKNKYIEPDDKYVLVKENPRNENEGPSYRAFFDRTERYNKEKGRWINSHELVARLSYLSFIGLAAYKYWQTQS